MHSAEGDTAAGHLRSAAGVAWSAMQAAKTSDRNGQVANLASFT
ncbi:hypothetical protein ABZ958_32095 [Streptomyces sp. NPDC046237]